MGWGPGVDGAKLWPKLLMDKWAAVLCKSVQQWVTHWKSTAQGMMALDVSQSSSACPCTKMLATEQTRHHQRCQCRRHKTCLIHWQRLPQKLENAHKHTAISPLKLHPPLSTGNGCCAV